MKPAADMFTVWGESLCGPSGNSREDGKVPQIDLTHTNEIGLRCMPISSKVLDVI